MHISIKMKKELFVDIEIPKGVEANIEGDTLIVKGPEGENKRTFNIGKLNFEIKENKIVIGSKNANKNDKKRMNTIQAHIRNLIKGVQEKFEYQLKICFGHFPLTVKQEGNKVIIKNFLGEKVNREVNVPEGAELDIGKEIIKVKSVDKEIAGQAAANFEAATKIRARDNRIFQDGIYIINKAGKTI